MSRSGKHAARAFIYRQWALGCSAGIEQSEEMKRFLWDSHFAAAASDMPTLERWPTPEGVPHLHQTLLG